MRPAISETHASEVGSFAIEVETEIAGVERGYMCQIRAPSEMR